MLGSQERRASTTLATAQKFWYKQAGVGEARACLSGKHTDSKAENLNQSGCSQLTAGTILSGNKVARAHREWAVVCLAAPEDSPHLEARQSAVRGQCKKSDCT